jgi:four helix bundle protein
MTEIKRTKQYDLEERTFCYARRVITLVNAVIKTIPNIEISKQLIRSSGSVGANYIEANEALSKKDFIVRIKYAVKSARRVSIGLSLLQ